jgi:hypothetical protein
VRPSSRRARRSLRTFLLSRHEASLSAQGPPSLSTFDPTMPSNATPDAFALRPDAALVIVS